MSGHLDVLACAATGGAVVGLVVTQVLKRHPRVDDRVFGFAVGGVWVALEYGAQWGIPAAAWLGAWLGWRLILALVEPGRGGGGGGGGGGGWSPDTPDGPGGLGRETPAAVVAEPVRAPVRERVRVLR